MLKCELEPMEYAITMEEALVDEIEDFDEEDYFDDYDEVGFNPYMGCYDFDCWVAVAPKTNTRSSFAPGSFVVARAAIVKNLTQLFLQKYKEKSWLFNAYHLYL